MKDSVFLSIENKNNSIIKKQDKPNFPRNKRSSLTLDLYYLEASPLLSPTTNTPLHSLTLEPGRPYTIGRTANCDFRFVDPRISKRHCQVLFDGTDRKIYLLDGFLSSLEFVGSSDDCVIGEFRSRLNSNGGCLNREGRVKARVSLNGVFVNGVRLGKGSVRELNVGDEILFACGNGGGKCGFGAKVGFLIKGVVFKEEVVMGLEGICEGRSRFVEMSALSVGQLQGSMSSGKRSKRVFALPGNEVVSSINGCEFPGKKVKCGCVVARAKRLLSHCRSILGNDEPVSYIRQYSSLTFGKYEPDCCNKKLKQAICESETRSYSLRGDVEAINGEVDFRNVSVQCANSHVGQDLMKNGKNGVQCIDNEGDCLLQNGSVGMHNTSAVANGTCEVLVGKSMAKGNGPCVFYVGLMKSFENKCMSPGKKFYLNRLQFMDHVSSNEDRTTSLPELLYPVESISRIFIATFTSDILWFLSCCKIPCHLPITVACHNAERCWSASPEKRTSVPFPEFPNLTVVFPLFPEVIAFGNDRNQRGVACHHPKLLVLQREDSIRVIVTSANLVANQWNNVTNNIWWQDFRTRSSADFSSLFPRLFNDDTSEEQRSDFAAQLAGFMASLIIDVPSQAHWITELAKYNFDNALGHLVASVPGIHSRRSPHYAFGPFDASALGTVEASVVGLSHLFRTATDMSGIQLKRLAAFLGKSHDPAFGMLEVVLRRNTYVPADANAVSILVPNPDQSEGGCVQLGFLPRYVAKWVSPLWDSGLFRFSGYIHRKEALAAALGGSNGKVQLTLHVFEGPVFSDMQRMTQPENVVAFCSLIASVQRSTGLWRLQEVLGRYKWPESEQSDFIYGCSSIGSINAKFMASFAAAVGKRSAQLFDSEESDPEWGCWSATEELRNPSIRIIFPTIERVKNACHGISSSRRILCFSEKTWQRLKPVDILHDAVPHPHYRVGHPMHVKVAWRRFWSKRDASSSGWVYCGSHNFSAAAWGRSIPAPSGLNEHAKMSSSLGLRLHICNYELGIIFVFPPSEGNGIFNKDQAKMDDIVLPFVVPAHKYRPTDRPATAQAMKEAMAELAEQEQENYVELPTDEEVLDDEILDEEDELVKEPEYVTVENEDEKAYADILWSQVESSQSC